MGRNCSALLYLFTLRLGAERPALSIELIPYVNLNS